jgi:hypothetical protein
VNPFLWTLVVLAILAVALPVGIIHFGHLVGITTHRWHVRQISARKVVDPKKTFRCYETVQDRWGNFENCGTRAETPCGKCWDHCNTCVRTEATKPERQNRALEIEMGMDQ